MTAVPVDLARSRIVLIGVPSYTNEDLGDYEVIRQNVIDLKGMLTDEALGGFDPAHCTDVRPEASIPDIGDLLGKAAEEAEDLLLFYYCGHGLVGGQRDRQLYLSVRETVPGREGYTALPFEVVRRDFLNSKAARRLAILDCCFSGRALDGRLGLAGTEITEKLKIEGASILASAPPNESALVLEGEQHTAFTGRLLDVLRDGHPGLAADLTLADIWRLLQERLRRAGLPEMQYMVEGWVNDLPLVRNHAYDPARPTEAHEKPDGRSRAPATPPQAEPRAAAAVLARRLEGLRARGLDEEADSLILKAAREERPELLVALLGRLEKGGKTRPRGQRGEWPLTDVYALSAAVGRHRYYKDIPQITLGLDREEGSGLGGAWEVVLRESGTRHVGELRWLAGNLTRGSGLLIEGTCMHGPMDTWWEVWNHEPGCRVALLRGAAKHRSTEDLIDIAKILVPRGWPRMVGIASGPSYLGPVWSDNVPDYDAEMAIGTFRPIDSLPDIIGWMQGHRSRGDRWQQSGTECLHYAALERGPSEGAALVVALRKAGQDRNADEALATIARGTMGKPYAPDEQNSGKVLGVIDALREVGLPGEIERLLILLAREGHASTIAEVLGALKESTRGSDAEILLRRATRQKRSRRRALREALYNCGLTSESKRIGQAWWPVL